VVVIVVLLIMDRLIPKHSAFSKTYIGFTILAYLPWEVSPVNITSHFSLLIPQNAALGFTDRLASFNRRVEHLEGDLHGASKLEEVGDHVIEPTSCRGQMGAITLVTAKLEEAKSRVAGLNVSSIPSMWTLYVDQYKT